MKDVLLIVGLMLLVLIVAPVITTKNAAPSNSTGGTLTSPSVSGYSYSTGSATPGQATGQAESRDISISSGNAPYTYQPYEEYIVLYNQRNSPLNITGWQLKNGKGERAYYLGGSLQYFSADIAIIPQATKFLLPNGASFFQDVVLAPGERAIITTGQIGVRSPVEIKSFKENACTGYLERHPNYAFEPSLSLSCPRPADEPGLEAMDVECRDFVKSLSSCSTPEFENKDREGEPCSTCIRGKRLSGQCAAFIREHFSYQGCIAYHAGDPEFDNEDTWRVFLGRGWEMWSNKYESINVFDRLGNLIKSYEY